jgi:hypothetical protein
MGLAGTVLPISQALGVAIGLIAISCFHCVASLATTASPALRPRGVAMKESKAPVRTAEPQWECRRIMTTPADKLMQALANEAREGWELVSVLVEEPYYRAFLKRPTGFVQTQPQ